MSRVLSAGGAFTTMTIAATQSVTIRLRKSARCGRYDQEARRRSTAGRMRSRASARLTPDISRES